MNPAEPVASRQNRNLLTLLTRESASLSVDINERTEMLHDADRWIPTHVLIGDAHGSCGTRAEMCLKSLCHVVGLLLERIATTKSAIHGE